MFWTKELNLCLEPESLHFLEDGCMSQKEKLIIFTDRKHTYKTKYIKFFTCITFADLKILTY